MSTTTPVTTPAPFAPLDAESRSVMCEVIRANVGTNNDKIQALLLNACFDAFNSNYKQEKEVDGVKVTGYYATAFNEDILPLLSLGGISYKALIAWVSNFAPVTYSAKSNSFSICSEDTNALTLWALSEDSNKLNTFWAWVVERGLADKANHWYLFGKAKAKKEDIAKVFALVDAEKEADRLCALLTKNQYGGMASAIKDAVRTYKLVLEAAKVFDALWIEAHMENALFDRAKTLAIRMILNDELEVIEV